MSENQIKEYLEKYQIKSKEGLAEHIEQLKKNTVPNVKLISELVYVLEDEELVFNSFFRENKKVERRINSMFLDEILEQSNQNSSPTRHKSKEGETHTEVPSFTDRDIANIQALSNLYKNDIKTIENNTKEEVSEYKASNLAILKLAEELKVKQESGEKETKNKTDYSEIDFDILDLMAERFNANKHKYPKGNMLKPIEEKELLFAGLRHLKKMIQPLESDEETFLDHLSAILCNMQMVYQQRKLKKC